MRSPEKRYDPTGRTHDESPRDRQTGTERGPTTIHKERPQRTPQRTPLRRDAEVAMSRHVTISSCVPCLLLRSRHSANKPTFNPTLTSHWLTQRQPGAPMAAVPRRLRYVLEPRSPSWMGHGGDMPPAVSDVFVHGNRPRRRRKARTTWALLAFTLMMMARPGKEKSSSVTTTHTPVGAQPPPALLSTYRLADCPTG